MNSDERTFTIAGTSTWNGESTYRFATGRIKVRAGVLRRNGHTDIVLFDLPRKMTMKECIAHLNTEGIFATLTKTGRKPKVIVVANDNDDAVDQTIDLISDALTADSPSAAN